MNSADNPVEVKVLVEVKQPKVTNIEIIRHTNLLGGKAEVIVDDILEQQSLMVDKISGATASSNCILYAVEDALLKGYP